MSSVERDYSITDFELSPPPRRTRLPKVTRYITRQQAGFLASFLTALNATALVLLPATYRIEDRFKEIGKMFGVGLKLESHEAIDTHFAGFLLTLGCFFIKVRDILVDPVKLDIELERILRLVVFFHRQFHMLAEQGIHFCFDTESTTHNEIYVRASHIYK